MHHTLIFSGSVVDFQPFAVHGRVTVKRAVTAYFSFGNINIEKKWYNKI